MRSAILLLLFFQLFTAALFAQSITGQVLEPGGAPAAFASIRLYRLPDSAWVTGASADAEGRFQLLAPGDGRYFVQAGLVGFNDVFSGEIVVAGAPQQLPALTLAPLNDLQTVTVTSRRPLIERQLDKVVVNVEGSALAAGNSAYELLQRAPGVVITPQDAILLNGKSGVLITIDGRPTQLAGADLAAFLRATPAENIAALELIANPSSKYDAAGVAGIINIRLKKNRSLGLNGSLSANYAQALHHRASGGMSLNYRPGPINFYSTYNLSDAAQLVDQQVERLIGDQLFTQDNPATSDWRTHSWKAGADWFAGDRHTFGLLALGSNYDHFTRADGRTELRGAGATTPGSSLMTARRSPEQHRRWNYNINYRYADTLGTEWTLDADRIEFRQAGQNQLANTPFTGSGQALQTDQLLTDLTTDIQVWAFKTDLAKTLQRGFKIEGGAKFTWSRTQNGSSTSTDSGDGFLPDPGRSNRFAFREDIAAAYANAGRQGKRWGWQLGLRAERTRVSGRSTDFYGLTENRPDTAYFGLFPTAFLQFQLNEKNQLGLSLNRRLQRPAYQDLNPFIWQTDPYTSERGNPYLRPAYTVNGELNYTYKSANSVALSYARTSDVVSTIARQVGDQAFTQPENLARQEQISLNFNAPLPIAGWWEGYVWLGVWHNRFFAALPDGPLEVRAFGGGCWLSQQFSLPHGLQLEASGWAQFRTREGMFSNRGLWNANLGLKKKILQDRITVKLAWWDVFNSQRWMQSADFGPVRSTIRNDWESQAINLGLSWNFGRSKGQGRDRKIGAENEDGRIRRGKS